MASVKSRRDSWREAGHASTSRPVRGDHAGSEGLVIWPQNHQGGRFPGLGLKTGGGGPVILGSPEGFPVWASELGVAPSEVGRPGGFGGLGLKTTKAAGFSVWASKPRSGPGETGRPKERAEPRGEDGLDGLGLKTITVEGFPVLASKPGSGPGATGRPGGRVAHARRLRGSEAIRMPISRDRPMGRKRKTDKNAPAWAVLVYLGEGQKWKLP
jgi:hypothetical protein